MEPLRITDPQLLVQVQKEIGALKRRSEASASGVSSAKKLNVEVLGLIKKTLTLEGDLWLTSCFTRLFESEPVKQEDSCTFILLLIKACKHSLCLRLVHTDCVKRSRIGQFLCTR